MVYAFQILFRLLCAHFLSDFALQSDKLCDGKRGKLKHNKLFYQIIHSAIHALLAYLFVARWDCWIIPVVIFVTHLVIDYTKYSYKKNNLGSFLIDQLLHVLVIVALWVYVADFKGPLCAFAMQVLSSYKFWVLLLAYILMLQPMSILLSIFVRQLTVVDDPTYFVTKYVRWIGYIERFLVLSLMISGHFVLVGFVFLGKAIFLGWSGRSDTKSSANKFIYSLANFSSAILVGLLVTLVIP